VRLLLIVNGSATSVTPLRRVVIHKALAADHEVELAETSGRGHAVSLARQAASEGADAVVVLGGDGTLNEAANGLAGSETALGVLPGGSTNVFARTLGMSTDPIEATGSLLAALASRHIAPVGLGRAGERYFLFHAGMGFDAAVVERAERHHPLKRRVGPGLFVASAIAEWIGPYDRRHPHFKATGRPAEGGEAPSVEDGYLGICLNTNPYTYLGSRPLDLVPGTGLGSRLSMVVLRGLGLSVMLPALLRALRGGRSGRLSRKAEVWRDLAGIEVQAIGPLRHQVDGECLGEVGTLDIAYEPAALRLVLPLGQ
jgi:diacylglycerol kinase family enzyme